MAYADCGVSVEFDEYCIAEGVRQLTSDPDKLEFFKMNSKTFQGLGL